MSLLLKEYREIFDRSKRTSLIDSGDYNVARLVPGNFFEGGWTKFSFSSSQLKKTDKTKTQEYSGGASYGFFGGAKGGHKRLDTSNSINFEGATMSFELTQVPIVRTWFREDFLTSTKWRPKAQSNGNSTVNAGEILSNGNRANPKENCLHIRRSLSLSETLALRNHTTSKWPPQRIGKLVAAADLVWARFLWVLARVTTKRKEL